MKEKTVGLIYVQSMLVMKGYFNCVSWDGLRSAEYIPALLKVTHSPKGPTYGEGCLTLPACSPGAFPHPCHQLLPASSHCGPPQMSSSRENCP